MGPLITLIVALSAAATASALTPITDSNIDTARDLWFSNEAQCISEYGHISDWDTAEVTNMDELFMDRVDFNEDLSKWNVGKVTSMYWMFEGATSFTSDLSNWNVGSVTRMDDMFANAYCFDCSQAPWASSCPDDAYAPWGGPTMTCKTCPDDHGGSQMCTPATVPPSDDSFSSAHTHMISTRSFYAFGLVSALGYLYLLN